MTARRLNRTEYNNTIRDLLGVTLRPADEFPVDDSGYGFDNIGDVLSMSPMLMEKYMNAARTVSRAAVFGEPYPEKPTLLVRLMPKKIQDDLQASGSVTPFSAARRDVRDLSRAGRRRVRIPIPAIRTSAAASRSFRPMVPDEDAARAGRRCGARGRARTRRVRQLRTRRCGSVAQGRGPGAAAGSCDGRPPTKSARRGTNAPARRRRPRLDVHGRRRHRVHIRRSRHDRLRVLAR